jgi:hypothetical protein
MTSCVNAGVRMMARLTARVKKLFEITRLDSIFDIHGEVGGAVGKAGNAKLTSLALCIDEPALLRFGSSDKRLRELPDQNLRRAPATIGRDPRDAKFRAHVPY